MKLIALLFSLFIFTVSNAQGIKLNDLSNFLTKSSVDEIRTILESKGWKFYRTKESDIPGVMVWTWTYHYTGKSSDKAVAWMSISCDGTKPLRSYYEIFDFDLTLPFSNSISESDFKYEHIEQNDEEFTKRYSNAKYYLWEYQNKDFDKGHQYECIVKNSKLDNRNGTKRSYYPSGQLKSEYELKNGVLSGKSVTYYENGKLKKEGQWKNDKEEGLFKFYTEEGILDSDETYVAGKLEGPAHFYYPNGQVEIACVYSYGKKSGKEQYYTTEGEITKEYSYIGGKKFGDYKEFTNGKESFTAFYMDEKLNGLFTETLFDEENTPYAIMKGRYKDGELDGKIVAKYIATQDTLSVREYKNQKPFGEWRYYDENKLPSKVVRFNSDQTANKMQYFIKGVLSEEITLTKTDENFWYFLYTYTSDDVSITANYRVPRTELGPNGHEFKEFENETQIFEEGGVVDSYYKYGIYTYETPVLLFTGKYDDTGLKNGNWSRTYKKLGIDCALKFKDGVLTDEYFTKKGKEYSGKLTYESSGTKYVIRVKKGLRNGLTEESNKETGTVDKYNYVNGELVE